MLVGTLSSWLARLLNKHLTYFNPVFSIGQGDRKLEPIQEFRGNKTSGTFALYSYKVTNDQISVVAAPITSYPQSLALLIILLGFTSLSYIEFQWGIRFVSLLYIDSSPSSQKEAFGGRRVLQGSRKHTTAPVSQSVQVPLNHLK